ncbi:hypothetical protein BSKO_09031 [Bryopsis sp. KO-2023]|nr:hypothetical protein BSKO_09031 [Bryopsis sp. KO-2023]
MLGRLCRRREVWGGMGSGRWFSLAADVIPGETSTSGSFPSSGEVESLKKRLKISEHEVGSIHARMGEEIKLEKSQLRDMLGSMEKRGNVGENMDLLKEFGFTSGDQKSLLMRSPVVFTEGREKLEKFWGHFVKEFNFDDKQLKYMVLFQPRVLEFDLEREVIPSLNAFLDMGFSKDQTKKIVLNYPHGLETFGETLEPMLEVFRGGGFSKNDFVELVSEVPNVVKGTVEDKKMLIKELMANGLSQEETRVLLTECESLSTESYEDNLLPKFQFLEDMGLSKLIIIHKIIKKAGLSFSRVRLETMKESFRCLISLGISQDMYKEMVCRSPFILGQGPQGLREKIDFTTEVMKRKVDEIARWSPYLTYSLERRIMYRAAIKLSTGEDLTGLSLRNFMLQSHVKFCRRYKKDHIDRLTEWWQGLTKKEKWEAVEKQKFMEG